jgi:hypothetical protein
VNKLGRVNREGASYKHIQDTDDSFEVKKFIILVKETDPAVDTSMILKLILYGTDLRVRN